MFRFCHLQLLVAAIASLLPTGSLANPDINIIDLSQPWEYGNLNNIDAIDYESEFNRDIRRFLVIDNGVVVMDYQRDNIADDQTYHLWSTTKVIMSTIFGVLISSDKYDISINETLADVFTNETAWSFIEDPEELEYKKSITIYELLTMTSGLNFGYLELNPFSDEWILQNVLDVKTLPNRGGTNLQESLSFPDILDGKRGDYHYLQVNNILSYVIKERTGMTPLEFASLEIFPYLGIDPAEITWEVNDDGMHASFTNLYMTTHQMAKFGQWYLQKGMVSPDKSLVSESYVNAALTYNVWGTEGCSGWYGYLWCFQDSNSSGVDSSPEDYVLNGAYGNFGQGFLFNYATGRVVSWQRSNTLYDKASGFDVLYGPEPGLAYRGALPEASFQEEAPEGYSSAIGSSVPTLVAATMVFVGVLGWFF